MGTRRTRRRSRARSRVKRPIQRSRARSRVKRPRQRSRSRSRRTTLKKWGGMEGTNTVGATVPKGPQIVTEILSEPLVIKEEPQSYIFNLKKIYTGLFGGDSMKDKPVTITIFPKKEWIFWFRDQTSNSKGVIGKMVYKGLSWRKSEEDKKLFIGTNTKVSSAGDKIRLDFASKWSDTGQVPLPDGQTYSTENAGPFIDFINNKIPEFLESEDFEAWRTAKWEKENSEIDRWRPGDPKPRVRRDSVDKAGI